MKLGDLAIGGGSAHAAAATECARVARSASHQDQRSSGLVVAWGEGGRGSITVDASGDATATWLQLGMGRVATVSTCATSQMVELTGTWPRRGETAARRMQIADQS